MTTRPSAASPALGLQMAPALISKKARGGRSWRGADNYDSLKPGAQLLDTNLSGMTAKERSAEVRHLRAANKSVARAVDHWSLSLDPRLGKLTDEQWVEVGRQFADQMGFGGCAYTTTRHVDEPQDHVHLILLRVRPDGSLVSDSNDFKRGHSAAALCAEAIGLTPLPPRPDATTNPAPFDPQVASAKRSRRRGTPVARPAAIADALESAVSRSANLEEFERNAADAGLQLQVVVKSGGEVQGLNVRPLGADAWIKASNLRRDRSLSWPKLEARLARNGELRARAQAQAVEISRKVREHVAEQLEEQMDAKDVQQSQAVSFVTPDAARQPLQPPDDAASPANEVEVQRVQRELDAEMHRLSFEELLDLRNSDRVPPIVLAAELLERLLNLAIRLLSLGRFTPINTLSELHAGREELARRAAAEIKRRCQRPCSAAERTKTLAERERALRARVIKLGARGTARSLPRVEGTAESIERRSLEALFDRGRLREGRPTIGASRRTVQRADTEIASLIGVAPRGLIARLRGEIKRHGRQLSEAKARRSVAISALQDVLDELERVASRAYEEEMQLKRAIAKAEKLDLEQLGFEICEISRERQLTERDSLRERAVHQSADVPQDAEEQQRERGDFDAPT